MISVSKKCIQLIKYFEGLRLSPYHGDADPPNVFTIGYGTIKYPPDYFNGKKVELTDPSITEPQAADFLYYFVRQKALAIDPFLRDDLTENQYAALISFAYNLGEGALRSSTLLKKLTVNPKDVTIRDEFMKWVHGEGGVVLEGLKRRRKEEADLYFTV